MELIRHVVVLDAADIAAESTFWAGMLDGRVVADDAFHCVIDGAGHWRLGVQLAPDHAPPDWSRGEQQVHVDLHVAELAPAHERAMALGATLLRAADDPDTDEGHQVYADPAGHPFCIGWGHPTEAELRRFLARLDTGSDVTP